MILQDVQFSFDNLKVDSTSSSATKHLGADLYTSRAGQVRGGGFKTEENHYKPKQEFVYRM